MRRKVRWSLVAALFFSAAILPAQAPSQPTTAPVTFGHSFVPLYGPWKFHIGDSPIDPKTGKPLWAESDFDDSHWETVTLAPQKGSIDPTNGRAGYVPGWTENGHPGYWGYAWYRIRVPVAEAPAMKLAFAAWEVDDAYQIYSNGRLVGGWGEFPGHERAPRSFYTFPAMFLLGNPASQPGSNLHSNQISYFLAIRVWKARASFSYSSGGFHCAPLLGEASAVSDQVELLRLEAYLFFAYITFEAILFPVLAFLLASLTFFDRSDHVYLGIAGMMLVHSAFAGFAVLTYAMQGISLWADTAITGVFVLPLLLGGWAMVWWVWFRLRRPAWIPKVISVLVVAQMVTTAFGLNLVSDAISLKAGAEFYAASILVRLILAGFLIYIVSLGIRQTPREGWLVLPVAIAVILTDFEFDLAKLHVPILWVVHGVAFYWGEVAMDLMVVVLGVLLLRRLLQSLKRQRQMALDVKQAQEVQQVILPEQRVVFHGFEIESEYRPAREVGGDFFQIIPNEKDGSLLIVAGDVTGKGLKAGMLVALLAGAIRSTAELEPEPGAILSALNRRLLGRGDAQATCLALRIERDGSATLANAGHLPPYLNGTPLAIEGSLPLGLVEQFMCSTLVFRLAEKDRLLLLSDGVAEATDPNGKLFGFERVLELIRNRPSAASIAETAQAFGQEDDISVIAVTRIPAVA